MYNRRAWPGGSWLASLLRHRGSGLRHQQEGFVLLGLAGIILLYAFLARPCFLVPRMSGDRFLDVVFGVASFLLAWTTFIGVLAGLFLKRTIIDYVGDADEDGKLWNSPGYPTAPQVMVVYLALVVLVVLVGAVGALWGSCPEIPVHGYNPGPARVRAGTHGVREDRQRQQRRLAVRRRRLPWAWSPWPGSGITSTACTPSTT